MKKNLEFGGLLSLHPLAYLNFDRRMAGRPHPATYFRKNLIPTYYGLPWGLPTAIALENFENLFKYLPLRTP